MIMFLCAHGIYMYVTGDRLHIRLALGFFIIYPRTALEFFGAEFEDKQPCRYKYFRILYIHGSSVVCDMKGAREIATRVADARNCTQDHIAFDVCNKKISLIAVNT